MSAQNHWMPIRLVLNGLTRIIALACLLASLPAVLVSFPWLPGTAADFVELRGDPPPLASNAYWADRERRFEEAKVKLLLYALGAAALCGLKIAIVYPLPEPGVLITWIVTACAAIGLIRFMEPVISPGNNTGIAVVMIDLPTGIVAAAALGMLVSLGRFFVARRTRELPSWFPV